MKSIMIIRTGEERGAEHPYHMELKVRSLLGSEPIELPLKSNPLQDILEGVIVGKCMLYEKRGGAVLYNVIDRLHSRTYIGHLILIGFEEDNNNHQKLKDELEKLASRNPTGYPKTFEEFYPRGIPPIPKEILESLDSKISIKSLQKLLEKK